MGEHLGAKALFRTAPAPSDLVATAPTAVLRLRKAQFEVLVRNRPWLGVELLMRLGKLLA